LATIASTYAPMTPMARRLCCGLVRRESLPRSSSTACESVMRPTLLALGSISTSITAPTRKRISSRPRRSTWPFAMAGTSIPRLLSRRTTRKLRCSCRIASSAAPAPGARKTINTVTLARTAEPPMRQAISSTRSLLSQAKRPSPKRASTTSSNSATFRKCSRRGLAVDTSSPRFTTS
jgi:hypothetical protein